MDKHRRQLDASVGASGPPGFAVCNSLTRLLKLRHPPHPAPNVRDDGETPLVRVRDNCRSIAVSSKSKSEIFFTKGLDRRANHAGVHGRPKDGRDLGDYSDALIELDDGIGRIMDAVRRLLQSLGVTV